MIILLGVCSPPFHRHYVLLQEIIPKGWLQDAGKKFQTPRSYKYHETLGVTKPTPQGLLSLLSLWGISVFLFVIHFLADIVLVIVGVRKQNSIIYMHRVCKFVSYIYRPCWMKSLLPEPSSICSEVLLTLCSF